MIYGIGGSFTWAPSTGILISDSWIWRSRFWLCRIGLSVQFDGPHTRIEQPLTAIRIGKELRSEVVIDLKLAIVICDGRHVQCEIEMPES